MRKDRLIGGIHKNLRSETHGVVGASILSGAKKKGVWFGTSKDGKVIHLETEKQMFGKQLFTGAFSTMGHLVHIRL